MMLQKEWSCSKEPVWRVKVPADVLKACNKEIGGMSRYFRDLSENGKVNDNPSAGDEELLLFHAVYATKDAYVLIRVSKKLLTVSKEAVDKKKLVVTLDHEEYRLVVARFGEYLQEGLMLWK